jgi:hypothetical protein
VAFTLILLPYWLGGSEFSFYQGWIHDQFAYLGTALTFMHETFTDIHRGSKEWLVKSPVGYFATIELFRRPTIMHLFGILSRPVMTDMYRLGYLFLAIMVANGILAATFLMTNIFNCTLMRAAIVASAIFVGFWGQLYIDFNAWSMTGAMPILLLITTYIIVAVNNIQLQMPLKLVDLLPLSCLLGFAVYIYPENAIFHLPALALTMLLALIFVGQRILIKKEYYRPVARMIFAMILGLALSAFYYKGTIRYFFRTVAKTSENVMTSPVYGDYLQPFFGMANWFRPLLDAASGYSLKLVATESPRLMIYYILNHIFAGGHLEYIYYMIVDGFYGFFGMYFFTPSSGLPYITQELWRAVLAVGLILFFLLHLNYYRTTTTTSRLRLYYIFVAIFTLMLFSFLCINGLYAMARGLYYLAPYSMILFFVPFLLSKKVYTLKNSLFILALCSQLGFGLARIAGAAEHHNPIYSLPYTMARPHYFLDGKTSYDWDFSRFDLAINNCQRIYINLPNAWQEYGVTLYLYSKGKEFVKKFPIKATFWDSHPIAHQTLNGKEDCAFVETKTTHANKIQFHQLALISLST